MKSDIVKIEIKPDDGIDIGMASLLGRHKESRFILSPSKKPSLHSLVESFEWNCSSQELLIFMNETADFKSLSWFSEINESKVKQTKSPLTNMEQDEIIINFDIQGIFSKFTFSELTLVDHKFILNDMMHKIKIKYEKMHKIIKEDKFALGAIVENLDNEWVKQDLEEKTVVKD